MRKRTLVRTVFPTALTLVVLLVTVSSTAVLRAHDGDEEAIYKVEGDVVAPVRLTGERPTYPESARQEKVEGLVVVRAVIDHSGTVRSTEVVQSAREDLDAAATDAIRTWTFEPATLEGEPVAVYYHLTVRFRLDKEKSKADDQEPSRS